jgi:hypothetical protein
VSSPEAKVAKDYQSVIDPESGSDSIKPSEGFCGREICIHPELLLVVFVEEFRFSFQLVV